MLAFTICGTADDLAEETRREVTNFAASRYRDFTPIAASDPVMWRDIYLNNREALLEMLGRFMEDAQAMARAVRWGDAAYIEIRSNAAAPAAYGSRSIRRDGGPVFGMHVGGVAALSFAAVRVLPSIQVVEAGLPGTVSRNFNGTGGGERCRSIQSGCRISHGLGHHRRGLSRDG